MEKTSRRTILLRYMALGAILGGFIFRIIIPELNFLSGALLGSCSAFIIFTLPDSSVLIETDPSLSPQERKKVAKRRRNGLGSIFLHPTHFPANLGVLWCFLAITTIVLSNTKNSVPLQDTTIALLPTCFLFGLSGYRMIKLNVFFVRHFGFEHGIPARLFGYIIVIICWGVGIPIMLAELFGF